MQDPTAPARRLPARPLPPTPATAKAESRCVQPRRTTAGRRMDDRLDCGEGVSCVLAFWAVGLVLGFALIHFGDGDRFSGTLLPSRFGNALYLSGTTLFTLGLGDITPASPLARFVVVLEAGIGFGFLALVIGYLPVLYQSFSRREVTISLLDARAGSPPTAFELLRRHAGTGERMDALTAVLHDWERLAAA